MNGGFHFLGNEEALIGKGRRRRCYRMPGTDLCVKFYHDPSGLPPRTRLSIRLNILLGHLCRAVNVNYREWQYHQRLLRRLPEQLASVFPEHTEPVYCLEKGWGIIESLILNADGTLPRAIIEELRVSRDAEQCLRLYREIESLFQRLVDHNVCFFDPSNILVQWTADGTFRLRIADFEPSCRSFIPGLSRVDFYVRCKVRRRAARYLVRLRNLLAKKHIAQEFLPARSPRPVSFFKRFALAAGLI
jgi:hypothetical protein